MNARTKTFAARPSALAYMLGAMLPSSGWRGGRGFPDLRMSWLNYRLDEQARQQLREGANGRLSESSLCLLLPHVTGFRLLMAMLTHPAWPLAIWGALQVRNRLVLHRPIAPDARFDLHTRVAAWRVLAKGLEVDLHTSLQQDGECAWESVVSFYYRGRFGPPAEHGAVLGAGTDPPAAGGLAEVGRWRVAAGSRRQFATLTGDYNGIHLWDGYARRFGFPAAFAHPQRIAAQCLARVPALDAFPQRLDLWIKGPVFFGSEVTLRRSEAAAGSDFGLWLASDARPALIGSQRRGALY